MAGTDPFIAETRPSDTSDVDSRLFRMGQFQRAQNLSSADHGSLTKSRPPPTLPRKSLHPKGTKETQKYTFDPTKNSLLIEVIHFVWLVPITLYTFFLFCLHKLGFIVSKTPYIKCISEEPTSFPVKRENSNDELWKKWLKVPRFAPTIVKPYTRRELIQSFTSISFYGTTMKCAIRLFRFKLLGKERKWLLSFVKTHVESAHGRLEQQKFIQLNFPTFEELLIDVKKMDLNQFGCLMDHLAEEFISLPASWFYSYIHARMWLGCSSTEIYDGSMSINSILFPEKITFRDIILSEYTNYRALICTAGLRVFTFGAIERCVYPPPNGYITVNKTSNNNTLPLLRCVWDGKYISFLRFFVKAEWSFMRNIHMIEIGMSCGHHLLFSEWTNSTIERAVWIAQIGAKRFPEETYERLVQESRKVVPDVCSFKSQDLLAFTIAGLCNFLPSRMCLWNLIGKKSAPFQIMSNPPTVTVRDLLTFGILKRLSKNIFEVSKLPCSEASFKMVTIEDRALLVKCAHPISFSASLDMIVCWGAVRQRSGFVYDCRPSNLKSPTVLDAKLCLPMFLNWMRDVCLPRKEAFRPVFEVKAVRALLNKAAWTAFLTYRA